jgi:hypothetical protein
VDEVGAMNDDRDYLYVRYDVTGMTPAEVDALTGEALAQAERSEGHEGTDAPTITFSHRELMQRIRRGLDRGGRSASFHLGDEAADAYAYEIRESIGQELGKGDGPNVTAHVRLDDEAQETLGDMSALVQSRGTVALFDPQDPGDAPLYLISQFVPDEIHVYATDCVDEGELERRLVRYFGTDGWEILTMSEMVS